MAILVAPAISQLPDVKPGRKMAISSPGESWIPAAVSREAYQKFILAVRNDDNKNIASMFPDSIKVLKGGSRIEVLEVDRLNIKRDYISDPSPGMFRLLY